MSNELQEQKTFSVCVSNGDIYEVTDCGCGSQRTEIEWDRQLFPTYDKNYRFTCPDCKKEMRAVKF